MDSSPSLTTRALSEVSSVERRRNSPSYIQVTRKTMGQDDIPSSSPFPSPYQSSQGSSPRTFWQGKLQENRPLSLTETHTPSNRKVELERLKSQSRVSKNMFQGSSPSYTHTAELPQTPSRTPGSVGKSTNSRLPLPSSNSKLSMYGSNNVNAGSPTKSSCLAGYHMNGPRNFVDDELARSESTRHSKQVTFDEDPQVQEFEPPTPDPSVTSTERSYDTDSEQSHPDDDSDDEYDLEDANIPVIGPEDWMPATPDRESFPRSTPSPMGSRPLPPLPPSSVDSASKLSPAGARPLPGFPQQRNNPGLTDSAEAPRRLTLEERLRLVMLQESPMSTPEKAASKQATDSPRPGDSGPQQDEKIMSLDDRMKHMSMDETANKPQQQQEMEEDEENDNDDNDEGHEEKDSDVSEDEGNESFSPVFTFGDSREVTMEEGDKFELSPAPRLPSFSTTEPEKLCTIERESARSDPEAVLASEFKMPRISRESIRRQMQARRNQPFEESNASADDASSPAQLKDSVPASDDSTVAKASTTAENNLIPEENQLRLSAIAQLYIEERAKSPLASRPSLRASLSGSEGGDFESDQNMREPYSDDEDEHGGVNAHDDDDDESKYSDTPLQGAADDEDDEPTTPTQSTFNEKLTSLPSTTPEDKISSGLPDLSTLAGNEDLGLNEYMTPSMSDMTSQNQVTAAPALAVPTPPTKEFVQNNRPMTPESQLAYDDGEFYMDDTGSVIRHQVYDSDEYDDEDYSDQDYEEELMRERSPSPVPERKATIRSASGTKLKTRKSATPADMEAMAAARRQVSASVAAPPVPAIPQELKAATNQNPPAQTGDDESGSDTETEREDSGQETQEGSEEKPSESSPSIPLPELELTLDVGMSDITTEFNRLIEAQKRGYLMRQNTKVIHATSEASEEKTSEKAKVDPQSKSWSVEPWKPSNSPGTRRRSLKGSDSLRKKPTDPGRQHHANAMAQQGVSKELPVVKENDAEPEQATQAAPTEEEEDTNQGTERGRLFVKVIGVKDLALPLPQGEPTYFCMTLDNGLHCVTTSWLELGKNAPIGQEFELVVLDDLEFQLTLQTKLTQPPPPATAATSIKAPSIASNNFAKVKSKSAFSNIFQSPKKRKEMERMHLLEQQRQAQAAALLRQQPTAPPTAWDLLHNLVARDGSFSRSYVSLKDFESKAFGRPTIVEVPCFNEWAVEMSSVKGKKNYIKKAPYKIGKLEVQLMFIPKGPSMTDNDMPKSMNSAIRELKEAENVAAQTFEGHLSQQGGDCPFWRRRFFRLEGCRLKAFHESTRQPRATINLSKAVKLIDDRNTLTTSSGSQKRRKSGFSEDEEGYMFVEEGFRVRFGNGECIDFYADSPEQKKQWMKVLNETIGRCPDAKGWCEMVLAKERIDRKRSQQQVVPPTPPADTQKSLPMSPPVKKTPTHQRTQSGIPTQRPTVPTTPHHQRTQSSGPAPRPQISTGSRLPLSPRTGAARPQSFFGGQFR